MKNSYQLLSRSFLLTALLLQFSCSWIGVREPAAKKTAPAITVDEVFSIESSGDKNKIDFKQPVMAILESENQLVTYETELRKDLPSNIAFKLQYEIEDGKYIVRILHSKNAFSDDQAVHELAYFISKLNSLKLRHNLSMFEMYYNAREGDLIALDNFLKIKQASDFVSLPFLTVTPEQKEERLEAAGEMRKELGPQIKELKHERKLLSEKRKALMDKLDKSPEGKQLRALVAKNDRKAVADLLEKYLPFEEMAPFEKRFWETHLEVIRKPVPLDQRVLIYRGLEDDFIHIAWEGNKELDKDEAIKEGKAFVMSTVLVKNQGSWNRRLRSLEAMNEKFIGTVNKSSEYSQSARISTMFLNHASDPKGSPFLSFTPKFGVAQGFGYKKMMSALIDPRVLHFNYVSGFKHEVEFLLPLVTFPDEMVGLWHQDYHSEIERNAFFKERLKLKITDEYGKAKADQIIARIEKNSADFYEPVLKVNGYKNKKVAGGTMAAFYKKFAKAGDFKPAMTEKGNLSCTDLLKIFWKIP